MSSGIRNVGVIGIGLMGSGIAQVAAAKVRYGRRRCRSRDRVRGWSASGTAFAVRWRVIKDRAVRRGLRRRKRQRLSHASKLPWTAMICCIATSSLKRLWKRKRQRNLICLCGMGYRKLFVSNTSSISITRLASSYSLPDRVIGMHFMNPVPVQPGCELIRGFLTSEETFQSVLEFCRELGREPILAEDKAGFGINRMFVPFLNEAVKVVEEGIMSCEDADKTTLCLGHKMGPITTLDYVGLDTTLAIAQVLEKELGPSYKASDLLSNSLPPDSMG